MENLNKAGRSVLFFKNVNGMNREWAMATERGNPHIILNKKARVGDSETLT